MALTITITVDETLANLQDFATILKQAEDIAAEAAGFFDDQEDTATKRIITFRDQASANLAYDALITAVEEGLAIIVTKNFRSLNEEQDATDLAINIIEKLMEMYPAQFPKEPHYNFEAQDAIKATICKVFSIPNEDE